jgi:hypothetical protein
MYLGSSGHQNLENELPEDCSPPGTRKGSKVVICIRGNVPGEFRCPKPENELPEDDCPPGIPGGSKVLICKTENVPREFRQPKPITKYLYNIAIWRAPPHPYPANPIPAMRTQLMTPVNIKLCIQTKTNIHRKHDIQRHTHTCQNCVSDLTQTREVTNPPCLRSPCSNQDAPKTKQHNAFAILCSNENKGSSSCY